MTDQIPFPPLHDLPPGELERRKRHLLTEIARRPRPSRSWRGALVPAVVVAALAGAGIAIAAGFGAFNGLGRVQAQTRRATLDRHTKAEIRTACHGGGPVAGFYNPYCHLVLDSARLLTDAPPWGKTYVIADTRGEICVFGRLGGCYPPLSKSQPITFGSGNVSPTTGGTFIAGGLAMDGVTSISFTLVPGGTEVTVPVTDNMWLYQKPDSHAVNGHCVLAHFADGSTVNPFPEVPCP